MASSTTSCGVRPMRSFSRTDCCAKIGAMPVPSTERMWPGVAAPNRSPKPKEVSTPSGTGFSQARRPRSTAAFAAVSGQSSIPFAISPLKPVVSPCTQSFLSLPSRASA